MAYLLAAARCPGRPGAAVAAGGGCLRSADRCLSCPGSCIVRVAAPSYGASNPKIWFCRLAVLRVGELGGGEDTLSQNHRITGWSGLAGTSVGHPVQPLPKQGHPEQAALGPCPGRS